MLKCSAWKAVCQFVWPQIFYRLITWIGRNDRSKQSSVLCDIWTSHEQIHNPQQSCWITRQFDRTIDNRMSKTRAINNARVDNSHFFIAFCNAFRFVSSRRCMEENVTNRNGITNKLQLYAVEIAGKYDSWRDWTSFAVIFCSSTSLTSWDLTC